MKRLLVSLLLTISIITGACAAVIPPDPIHGYGETLFQKTVIGTVQGLDGNGSF